MQFWPLFDLFVTHIECNNTNERQKKKKKQEWRTISNLSSSVIIQADGASVHLVHDAVVRSVEMRRRHSL